MTMLVLCELMNEIDALFITDCLLLKNLGTFFHLRLTSISFQRKETLPVREIQSVKAVRKGIRDIPKAFEIFTTDQNYVFKAKGQQNIEPWVQCIHLAVAKAQHDSGLEQQIVENMTMQRPRPTVRDTKL